MKRIESRASAAMRRASTLLRWAAELEAAAVPSTVSVDMMVGQFGRERGMRELIRIDAGFDEDGCLCPNGIVAAHENNPAPHQRRDRIILTGEGPRRILIIRGVGSRGLLLDDQRIGLELLAGQSGELILVSNGLIVER